MRYGDSQQLGRSVGGISIVNMRWADINKITRGPGGLVKDMVFRERGEKVYRGGPEKTLENPGSATPLLREEVQRVPKNTLENPGSVTPLLSGHPSALFTRMSLPGADIFSKDIHCLSV